MFLPYNGINTVDLLVIACTENGLVYSEWYFQYSIYNTYKKEQVLNL